MDHLPKIGLGTMGIDDPGVVTTAVDLGYRHLDTASIYENEGIVGAGIAASDVPREDLFVATKLWIDDLSAERVRPATEAALDRLGLDAVDLLYVHRPRGDYDPATTLPALDALRDDGLIRHVGLSNFEPDQLATALDVLDAPLFAHQVEFHPLFPQSALVDAARADGHTLVGYSPLAGGRVFDCPEVVGVAEKHDTTPAAVSIAWLCSKESVATIPKASSRAHLEANLAARDVALDDADVALIESVERRVELYPE